MSRPFSKSSACPTARRPRSTPCDTASSRTSRLADLLFARRLTSFVRRTLVDDLLPPALRDLRVFNRVVRKLWLGDVPMDFQREAWHYDAAKWRAVYGATHEGLVSTRGSDTSVDQIAWITRRIGELRPRTVVDVGSGQGLVASSLAAALPTGSRLYLVEPYQTIAGALRYRQVRAVAEALPFRDGAVDVLVCTHTLEHVPRLLSTFAEFRRVARRILVVVPLQRWSRYSWDLHLHFFPYLEYLPGLLETPAETARVIDGDGCYEFVPTASRAAGS